MERLVEHVAKSLVDHPDDVNVTRVEGEKSLILELRVNPEDMGQVIGRQGRIAKALRTVVKAAAASDDKLVHVEILD